MQSNQVLPEFMHCVLTISNHIFPISLVLWGVRRGPFGIFAFCCAIVHIGKMDFQHRVGGKTGSGGVASESEANRDRRERLRQLALDTIDLEKDPYFMKNHLGTYECKLCLTLHNNEGSYLAHTQGNVITFRVCLPNCLP